MKNSNSEIRQKGNIKVGRSADGFMFGMGVVIFIYGIFNKDIMEIILSLLIFYGGYIARKTWKEGKQTIQIEEKLKSNKEKK